MERHAVTSSNITSIGLEDTAQGLCTVEVEFTNGSIWQYFDVPIGTAANVAIAKSIGGAFHALIKSGEFRREKVQDATPKACKPASEQVGS